MKSPSLSLSECSLIIDFLREKIRETTLYTTPPTIGEVSRNLAYLERLKSLVKKIEGFRDSASGDYPGPS